MSTQSQLEIAIRAAALSGQAPTWDTASDSLLWVDTPANLVHRYTADQRDHTLAVPQHVSAAKPRNRGGLVLHFAEGIALFGLSGQNRIWLVYWARTGFGGGATGIDSSGRLWASTVRDDEGEEGWLARIHPDGAVSTAAGNLSAPRGLAWSPDNDRLYLVDSPTRRIDMLDFDPASGHTHYRRPLCTVTGTAGRPSGLCVDADGCLWVAVPGGAEIRRYTQEGSLDRSIPLPVQHPTGCCFGGSDLTDLYITSARLGLTDPGELDGAVLVLPSIATGLQTPAFAG